MTANTIATTDVAGTGEAENKILIDVRTPGEFREAHVPASSNVPLADLDRFQSELADAASHGEIVLVCRTGRRAEMARERLAGAGITAASVLAGGLDAWSAEGREVTRGKAGMSIERQVRVAAGSLVLVGLALGFTVDPNWHWLSGFVGGGLVFAGLTDTCGMAMALGLLPFNRVRTGSALTCRTS